MCILPVESDEKLFPAELPQKIELALPSVRFPVPVTLPVAESMPSSVVPALLLK